MSVFRHVALAVLIGIECAGVNVDVRIELLYRDAIATCLKELTQGGGDNALTKGRDHTTCDEDVLCFHYSLHISLGMESRLSGLSDAKGVTTPPKLLRKDTFLYSDSPYRLSSLRLILYPERPNAPQAPSTSFASLRGRASAKPSSTFPWIKLYLSLHRGIALALAR